MKGGGICTFFSFEVLKSGVKDFLVMMMIVQNYNDDVGVALFSDSNFHKRSVSIQKEIFETANHLLLVSFSFLRSVRGAAALYLVTSRVSSSSRSSSMMSSVPV